MVFCLTFLPWTKLTPDPFLDIVHVTFHDLNRRVHGTNFELPIFLLRLNDYYENRVFGINQHTLDTNVRSPQCNGEIRPI